MTVMRCTNATHDHTTTVDREGDTLPAPALMVCYHDGLPAHYDTTIEDYRHDQVTETCFLIPQADDPDRNPCTPAEVDVRDETLPCGDPIGPCLFDAKGGGQYVIINTAHTDRDGNVTVPATAWCTEGHGWVGLSLERFTELQVINAHLKAVKP